MYHTKLDEGDLHNRNNTTVHIICIHNVHDTCRATRTCKLEFDVCLHGFAMRTSSTNTDITDLNAVLELTKVCSRSLCTQK